MLTKYTLYIGLNDKDSKVQEISTLDAYKMVGALVGDCTIQEARGLYTHRDGTQVLETTLVVQVIDFSGALDVAPVVDTIKTALNQESVAVIREQVDSRLM